MAVVAGATALALAPASAATTPNLIPAGSFTGVNPTYVPWAGVDGDNNIHGLDGRQIMVDDAGRINSMAHFGPSAGVADLNDDGKNDLVLADSRGYFWYFPNTGTPQAPAFTQAEVIPIWLGEEPNPEAMNKVEGVDNVVPRIQLIDFSGGKKFDVVAGNYAGKLFRIPNVGSSAQPNFHPTQNRDVLMINTHRRGVLWCNYVAPFFTNAFSGNNIYDLIMGEGTYSANSIWYFHNTDTNDHPMFDEDHVKRIIPGMGLEQLTPCVVDWNKDGKPDIICGDRTGDINLYLNNSTDPSNPTFAPATQVSIGGQTKLGGALTVTVCDLSNNHLPNLLIGRDDGTVLYAVNTGTPGSPRFDQPATPLKGVLPPDYHYTALTQWSKYGAWGAPYEMLGATNPQLEPGFAFPDGVKASYAMRFWIWPYTNKYFQRYYMPEENELNEHDVECSQGFTLKMNTEYVVSFWVLAPQDSVSTFRFSIWDYGRPEGKWTPPGYSTEVSSSSQWAQVTENFRINNDGDPTLKQYGYRVGFRFRGQAPFYICDLQLHAQAP